jgi:hypothetical protein
MNLNPRRKVNFQKKFQLRTMKEEWKGPDVDHVFSNSRDKCLELTRFEFLKTARLFRVVMNIF